MLFNLPDHATLYDALLRRNSDYDGQAYVCVATTGVFCRLTCPARKPKSENCTFYPTVGECLAAGFRACKRCHPLQPMAAADPAIGALLAALEARPEHRWTEDDVERMGFDLSTVRRSFRRQFGMTFLEMARQRRLRDGFTTILDGGKVIDAQIDARFDSASAFRAAFAKLLGRAPGNLDTTPMLFAEWVATPLGDMIAVSSTSHLHLLEFVDRKALKAELGKLDRLAKGKLGIGKTNPGAQIKTELAAFFDGTSADFTTPLAYIGSPFAQSVWDELRRIPPGVGKGRFLDTLFVERLWRSLKYECVYLHAWGAGSEAKPGLRKWTAFYNHKPPQSSLGGHLQPWFTGRDIKQQTPISRCKA